MSGDVVKLGTGNDLETGDVIWWAGDGWSRRLADAVDMRDDREVTIAAEERARRVNAPYVVDAEQTADGPMPLHIKERIRGSGPTVRADLAIRPDLAIVRS